MINFIVVDDEPSLVSNVVEHINKVMMRNDFEYKISTFTSFNDDFFDMVAEPNHRKIYILDIMVNGSTESGIDIARYIRDEDINCVIMFLTMLDNMQNSVAEDRIMPLTYINKRNADNRLEDAIEQAIRISGKRNALQFQERGITYTIPTKDILYITTSPIERKNLIVTEYTEFKTNKTLTEFLSLLGEPFIETHRACIVNLDRVRTIDKRNKEILFDNGITFDLVSPKFHLEEKYDVQCI